MVIKKKTVWIDQRLWTKNALIEDGRRFETKSSWYQNSVQAYHLALASDFYEECTSHMANNNRQVAFRSKLITEMQLIDSCGLYIRDESGRYLSAFGKESAEIALQYFPEACSAEFGISDNFLRGWLEGNNCSFQRKKMVSFANWVAQEMSAKEYG